MLAALRTFSAPWVIVCNFPMFISGAFSHRAMDISRWRVSLVTAQHGGSSLRMRGEGMGGSGLPTSGAAKQLLRCLKARINDIE